MDGMIIRRGSRAAVKNIGAFVLSVLWLSILAAMPAQSQQASCENGIVRLPSNVNGQITICSELVSQVPALARQLNDLAAAQNLQQKNTQELVKLIKNLNVVGRNLGTDRQAQMLNTLSLQLGADNGTAVQELTDRLDELKDLLLEKLSDSGTEERTKVAINGPVGDAIAQLDVPKADSLLEDIQAQLHGIGNEVSEVHAQTTEIANTLLQQQQEDAQRKAESAAESERDPSQFARLGVQGMPARKIGPMTMPGTLMIIVNSPPPAYPSFVSPKLEVVFRDTQNHAKFVALSDRQQMTGGDLWRLSVSDFGSTLTVCFSAMDARIGHRRQLTQSYTVQTYSTQDPYLNAPMPMRVSITPVGEPTFLQADGETCDGLSQ